MSINTSYKRKQKKVIMKWMTFQKCPYTKTKWEIPKPYGWAKKEKLMAHLLFPKIVPLKFNKKLFNNFRKMWQTKFVKLP